MASQHARKDISVTHILADGCVIKAFYTLSNAHFDNDGFKNYPRQIPIVIIGRIGVDKRYQNQGLSKQIIKHALQTIKQISQLSGTAFAILDAKDEYLAQYYERLGFIRINGGLKLAYPVNQI